MQVAVRTVASLERFGAEDLGQKNAAVSNYTTTKPLEVVGFKEVSVSSKPVIGTKPGASFRM